jgi:hypothetical protein
MVNAMEQAKLEPVVIEDLVRIGEDMGIEKGRVEMARAVLRSVLALRKLVLGADAEARIAACTDPTTLKRWHDQAVLAGGPAEVFQ